MAIFKDMQKLGPWWRCVGQVVNVLTFHSDKPSSNPADAYSFCVNFVFETTPFIHSLKMGKRLVHNQPIVLGV